MTNSLSVGPAAKCHAPARSTEAERRDLRRLGRVADGDLTQQTGRSQEVRRANYQVIRDFANHRTFTTDRGTAVSPRREAKWCYQLGSTGRVLTGTLPTCAGAGLETGSVTKLSRCW